MTHDCLDCGALFDGPGSRCQDCYLAQQRRRNQRPARAIYGGDWPAESRAIRASEPWCHAAHHVAGCGMTVDLTVDHPTRAVLSRPCHAALEQARRKQRRFRAVRLESSEGQRFSYPAQAAPTLTGANPGRS